MENHSTLRTLWRFLRPESEELIAYVLVIMTMLVLAIYHVAVQGKIGTDSQGLITTLGSTWDTWLSFFNQDDKWGRFFLFGLWFFIGTVVYILSWALVTILIDINRDIKVSSSFVHPQSFHQSDYWTAILARFTLRITAGIALIFYASFWFAALAPVWLNSIEAVSANGFTKPNIIDAIAAVVGVAITLHIGAILLRIMLLRAEYSYR